MKSFLIPLLACLALDVNAQVAFKHSATNPTGAVVNTGIDTAKLAAPALYETVKIKVTVTKVSGTVAGTAILQRSVDGVDYAPVLGDTLTLSNVASQYKVFDLPKDGNLFYRVLTTGSGTMSATSKAVFAGKKTNF
jgi:hypothetical protein